MNFKFLFVACLSLISTLPQTAFSKQCVWNRGGYVVRVDWYERGALGLAAIEADGTHYYAPESEGRRSRDASQAFSLVGGRIRIPGRAKSTSGVKNLEGAKLRFVRSGEPLQTDQFLSGQGRCIGRPGGPYAAVVSAIGRQAAADSLRGFVGGMWLFGVAIAHSLCAEKYGCDIHLNLQLEVIQEETGKILEGAKDLFYIGIPRTDRWLDTWGTVYEPVTGPGGEIATADQTMTGCHLWTDDFDYWCAVEFASDWGMKRKVGGGCLASQGRADCAVGFKGGIRLGANEYVTGCHLWTDDFDYWCKMESGQADWGMKEKIGGGCVVAQGKGRCAAGYQGGKCVYTSCDPDSDGDGVLNVSDQCPNTTAGVKVNRPGCAILASLRGVRFDFDKADLVDAGGTVLKQQAERIKQNPTSKIEVGGHTDSTGPDKYNQTLSERRANTVRNYLIEQGVPGARLSALGYGGTRPIDTNDTHEGRAKNRRVELVDVSR